MSLTLKLICLHVCGIFILQQHLISGQSAFWGLRYGHTLGLFRKNWSLLWLLSAIFGLNLPHLNSDATQNECSTESSQSMKENLNKKCLVGGLRSWCVTILDPIKPWWVIAIPSNCYHRYYKLKEPNDKTTLNFWLFPDNEDIEAICCGRYSLSQRPTMIIPHKRGQPRRWRRSPGRRKRWVLTHKLCDLPAVTVIWRKKSYKYHAG